MLRDFHISGQALCLVVPLFVLASPLAAQVANGGAGGTVERETRSAPRPLSRPPSLVVEKPRAPGDDAGLQPFRLAEIRIEGNKVLPIEQLRPKVATLEGRDVTLKDLSAAADAITQAYAQAGYAISFALVPEQDVQDGVARIVVVEGRVSKVTVEVDQRGALISTDAIVAAVQRRADQLVSGSPLKTADLDRVLWLISDLPGVRVLGVLQPSTDTEGAAQLVIKVAMDPASISFGLDNRLRAEFGREQYSAGLALNSVLAFGDSLSTGTIRSIAEDAFSYDYVRYQTPLLGDLTVDVSLGRARSRGTRGLLGLLGFEGRENSAHAGLRVPILRSRSRNLIFSLSADAANTRSRLLGQTLTRDKVRSFAADLSYDWVSTDGATIAVGGTLTQGVEGLGSTRAANPVASRETGTPEFSFVAARFSYAKPIGPLTLRMEADAQATVAGRLLAPVACTYGGQRVGRGYDPGVIAGDHCLRTTLELAQNFDLGLLRGELFSFADGAAVRQKGTLTDDERRAQRATSIGAGVRLATRFGLSGEAMVTLPMSRSLAPEGREPRFFFSLNARW